MKTNDLTRHKTVPIFQLFVIRETHLIAKNAPSLWVWLVNKPEDRKLDFPKASGRLFVIYNEASNHPEHVWSYALIVSVDDKHHIKPIWAPRCIFFGPDSMRTPIQELDHLLPPIVYIRY